MKNLNLSEWALKHQQMVLFLLVICAFAGVYAYGRLGQKEDPDFTIKAMLVKAWWPGANARETAEQVTDRLERKLQEIPEIDYTLSYSRAGETQITVSLREDTKPERVPDVWYLVRTKLNDIKGELPQGVKGPYFNDDFGDTYGNLYAITGPGFSYPELRDFADAARNELLRVQDVSKVEIEGDQEQKIYIEASRAKLASLGIDPAVIAHQVAATNVVTPAGVVQAVTERVRVDVTGEFDSVEAIRNMGIRAGDRVFRLGDIAEVKRAVSDPPTSRLRFQGEPALGLAVSMRKGGDVIVLGRNLDQAIARIQASLPVGVQVRAISDQPKVVKSSVKEFTSSLAEAVAIVLVVSFFSLGMRTGLVVALSIPLVLAMTFLCMYLLDIELQRISLGALIIALGLLVDDAIIAVEMMALKLEQGWDRARAATFAYTATAFPMLTGTLITAAGFLPIGFAKSNAGQYVFSLFQVVGISLILSWIVAVVFTPYIGYHLLPEMKHAEGHDEDAVYQRGFYARFRTVVEWCLEHRRLIVGVTVGLFFASAGLFKAAVPQQFFPASARPEIMVQLWMPEAATTEATEAQVHAMEAKLRGDPDIAAVTSYVGRGSPRFYLPLDVQSPNVALAELMVMTTGLEARNRVTARIQKLFEDEFPEARGRVLPLENGPSVGYPVQFRVSGPDVAKVREYSGQVGEVMRANPNLLRVNSDWAERTKVLRVEIDQDKARLLGITSRDVADALQGAITGFAVTQYREGDKSIDVVSRLPEDERTDLNNLRDTKIYLSKGKFVPVSQVARLSLASEESVYWRRNRVPTITVRGDVSGAEGPDVTAALQPKLDELRRRLPIGYSIVAGGATEASATSQASIAAVVPAMILVVLVLLMLQLQDMKKMAIVLATAPLGVIGVAVMLATFRIPFGFVALLGVIALFGMIIRNSVILVVQIDSDLERGLALWDAIVESTVRRFRPIVLTAAAAILAMIPLTRSTFWGPMAWAIMGGLLVATLLTLLFLPALYAACYGAKRPASGDEPAPAQPEGPERAAAARGWRTRLAFAAPLLALLPSANAVDLVGAYAGSLQADPSFRAAEEALFAGREKNAQARSLYLPRVSLSANVNQVNDRSEVPDVLAAIAKEESHGRYQGAAVQASQPIYRPQYWAEARQLRSQAAFAETDHRQAGYELIERVTRAYFGLLLAEENVAVSAAQKAAVSEQLARSKARFEVGKGRVTDVEESQARYDSVVASEIAAIAQLDQARAQFTEVTALPPANLAGYGTRFAAVPPSPDDLGAWTSRALDGNYAVIARRSQVEIAAAEIEKHRLAGRPTVDLVASYGDKGQAGGLSPLAYPERARSVSVGLQVSIPLYAGGAYDSKERESRAKHRQAESELAAAQRDTRLQTRDAFNSVKSGAARIVALDQSVVSAGTSLEATIAGRDVGTRTTSDVLDAQQRFYNAQLDLARARHDYLLGRVKLASVAGTLAEDDLRSLNAYLK
jgi:multidrug efflux pump